jgi:tetratricopeptide (TPR) repeat protein
MRLLSLSKDDDVAWEVFPRHATPPYAILSHTWDKDEVSYSDLVSGLGRQKAGWRKIVFCGQQAARDGLGYFWVDTCCIDKWNKREREQAINGMFRWYKNAARSYVYLSDVSAASTQEAGQRSSWEASFCASKWFKRGWTLQELIAPSSVQFFSKEEQALGDKSTLEQPIHEVTQLPLAVLRGCSLDDFSKSERLQWAAGRMTTEPEDGAYCLLGIVGVQLPLTYGEGKEKAMARLREALKATSVRCILPYSRNERLVGRQTELAELEEILFSDKHTTKIAITGEGGIGKSQLALELAYRTKDTRKSCSIFWIDASNIDSLKQSYSHVARGLNVAGWDEEQADVQRLVHVHLNEQTAGEWLLVFDNMDDIDMWSAGSSGLINSLPQSELGSVVFTTIDNGIAKMLAPEYTIQLGGISSDSGQEMMRSYLDNAISPQDQKQVELLLDELSFLPLAVVHAAAFINTEGVTVKEYRSLLQDKRKALALPDQRLNGMPSASADDPVAATWLVTFEQLRHAHPVAADCLCFMGCISAKDIPLELLVTSPSGEIEDAIQVLGAYALITRRPADSAVDLHRLVHSAMHEWLEGHQLLDHWTQEAVARLGQVFPDDDHRNRHKWRRLLPHAQSLLSHVLVEIHHNGDQEVQKQFRKRRWLGRWTRREMDRLKIFKDINHGIFRALGRALPQTKSLEADTTQNEAVMSLLWRCAMALKSDGRWDEAKSLQVQELNMRLKKLEADHPLTLTSINNLALIYSNQGRWDDAEQLQVQVLETHKTKLGVDHLNTLTSMNNLASTYWNQGRWDDAEQLQVQVLETFKTKLGADHPDTLTSMANLALTYRNQGRWDDAEQLEVQVLETCKTKLGVDHPNTLASMANLASTYRNQGRWDDAEQLEVQVLETFKRKLGADHPDTLTSMNNLAYTWKGQGRDEAAVKLMGECVQLATRKLGADHPYALGSRQTLDKWQLEDVESRYIQ